MTVSVSRARKSGGSELIHPRKTRGSMKKLTEPIRAFGEEEEKLLSGLIRLDIEPEDFDARTFIHPTADVSPLAQVGAGCRLWQQVQIRERVIIGSQCNIGKAVYIDRDVVLGDFVKIQNYVTIPQGVMIEGGVFIGSNVAFTNDRYPRSLRPDGRLKGEGDFNLECTIVSYSASIGAGAVILPGVRIGSYAMIGAGAVVTANVPEHGLAIGNPARLVGYVCRCGKPLKLTKQTNTWQCESCHESYVFRP